MKLTTIILIFVCLLMTGCGYHYWRHPDKTRSFQRDSEYCKAYAYANSDSGRTIHRYTPYGIQTYRIQGDGRADSLYSMCMIKLGYIPISKEEYENLQKNH